MAITLIEFQRFKTRHTRASPSSPRSPTVKDGAHSLHWKFFQKGEVKLCDHGFGVLPRLDIEGASLPNKRLYFGAAQPASFQRTIYRDSIFLGVGGPATNPGLINIVHY